MPKLATERQAQATIPSDYVCESMLKVPAIARGYCGMGLEFDELIAAGNLGLVEAGLRFDPARGVKFMTYADWWIRKTIREAVSVQVTPIRLPRYQREKLRTLQAARRQLRATAGAEPDRDRLAETAGLSCGEVDQLQQAAKAVLSLEQASNPETGRPIKETLGEHGPDCPHCSLVRRDLTSYLRHHLTTLDSREQSVISMRYGLAGQSTLTLREAGSRLGISREGVRQLERRALRKLKQRLDGQAVPRTQREIFL